MAQFGKRRNHAIDRSRGSCANEHGNHIAATRSSRSLCQRVVELNPSLIATIWSNVETWLEVNSPTTLVRLSTGANAKDVSRIETTFDVTLPSEFRESLTIHDGETETEAWVFGEHSLLSVNQMVRTWRKARKLQKSMDTSDWDFADFPIQMVQGAFNSKWIPFAHDGAGGELCIDLDPSSNGFRGQVIQTTSEGQYWFVAETFTDFMQLFLDQLTQGAYDKVGDRLEHKSGRSDWWRP